MDWVCESCGDQVSGDEETVEHLQCPSCGEPVTPVL
jgi:predicted RNA-binding Zn-ribbon protein involved in translation (DUF1610 family)